MKLTLDHHHLAIKTPHRQQQAQIESQLKSWANDQLPRLLAARLAAKLADHGAADDGYICIKAVDIHLLLKMRHGSLATDIERWADDIMIAILACINGGGQLSVADQVRFYPAEAAFIAAYVAQLLHRDSVEWPFEHDYQASLSVNENIVVKLEQSVRLLPQVIERLRQQQQLSVFFRRLAEQDCRRLLRALACPAMLDVALNADLLLDPALPALTELLPELGDFCHARWLLMIVLLNSGAKSGIETIPWQSYAALLALIGWAIRHNTPACFERLQQPELPDCDDTRIDYLLLLSRHGGESGQRFADLIRWTRILLAICPGYPQFNPPPLSAKLSGLVGQAGMAVVSLPPGGKDPEQPPLDLAASTQAAGVLANAATRRNRAGQGEQEARGPHRRDRVASEIVIGDRGEVQAASPAASLPPLPSSPEPDRVDNQSAHYHYATRSATDQSGQPGIMASGAVAGSSPRRLAADLLEPRHIYYGGLMLVLAALLRYVPGREGKSEAFSPAQLWLLCCYALPEDLRPLAFSDAGLRLLCLGPVPWQDAPGLCRQVKDSAAFRRFCAAEALDPLADDFGQQLSNWVLRRFSGFIGGFEQSSATALFEYFIDWPGEWRLVGGTLDCRIQRPPLHIVIALSLLFNRQPSLPGWPDKVWHIGWQV